MKKTVSICMIFIIACYIVGCTKGSFVVLSGEENNTSTQMIMKYKKFTGYKETQIKVQEGEIINVSVAFVTDSGSLDAYIAKDNDKSNAIYSGNDVTTSSFTVALKEAGTYTLRVDGDKHSGSYSFRWLN